MGRNGPTGTFSLFTFLTLKIELAFALAFPIAISILVEGWKGDGELVVVESSSHVYRWDRAKETSRGL